MRLIVLGIAQDGGHPQAGCAGPCCAPAWADPRLGHRASCLGIWDPETGDRWLLDATPDLPRQLRALGDAAGPGALQGIALTHAHVGHYAGLIWLGREAMAADALPLYAMPRMRRFLRTHGPWELLLRSGHAQIVPIAAGQPTQLSPHLTLTPVPVPHRDEYSETVALSLEGPSRRVLYAPDLDQWTPDLLARVADVDLAFIDGTFYDDGELSTRDPALVPHPRIRASMQHLERLPPATRRRIHFIHLNHTNPCLAPSAPARTAVEASGLRIAREGTIFEI